MSGADRHIPDEFAWHSPPGVSSLEWNERCDLLTNWDLWWGSSNEATNVIGTPEFDDPRARAIMCGPLFCFMPAAEDDPAAVQEAERLGDAVRGEPSHRRREAMGTVFYMLRHYPDLMERAEGTDRQAEQIARSLQQLDKIIRQLPRELQEVLVARYKEGLSQADTGARLGVSQSTVSRREEKAVRTIAERSEEPYLLLECNDQEAVTYVGISPQEYRRIERAGQAMVGTILSGVEEFHSRYGSVAAVLDEEVRRYISDGDERADLRGELTKAVLQEWQKILTAEPGGILCCSHPAEGIHAARRKL